MKRITNSEVMRKVNGGGYYQCRVCGYSNKSFWNVYGHAIKHTVKATVNTVKVVWDVVSRF